MHRGVLPSPLALIDASMSACRKYRSRSASTCAWSLRAATANAASSTPRERLRVAILSSTASPFSCTDLAVEASTPSAAALRGHDLTLPVLEDLRAIALARRHLDTGLEDLEGPFLGRRRGFAEGPKGDDGASALFSATAPAPSRNAAASRCSRRARAALDALTHALGPDPSTTIMPFTSRAWSLLKPGGG